MAQNVKSRPYFEKVAHGGGSKLKLNYFVKKGAKNAQMGEK